MVTDIAPPTQIVEHAVVQPEPDSGAAIITVGDLMNHMAVADAHDAFFSNRMMMKQMVEDHIASITVNAEKVEIEDESDTKKPKSKKRGKIKTPMFFRRKKG